MLGYFKLKTNEKHSYLFDSTVFQTLHVDAKKMHLEQSKESFLKKTELKAVMSKGVCVRVCVRTRTFICMCIYMRHFSKLWSRQTQLRL